MSTPSPDSSIWNLLNKLIAIVLCSGAVYFPATFIYGGIRASIALHDPTPTLEPASAPAPSAQASTPAPAVTPTPAPASPAPSAGGNDTAIAAQVAEGQKTYMTVCFACHQPTGMGIPNMFPPLAGSDWVTAPKPDRIIRNVLHGVMGPLTINGKPFSTPAPMMPPQGAALTNKQVADVLTYVRNSWGNTASAVTADEVQTIREAEKSRSAMWTEAELLKIADR